MGIKRNADEVDTSKSVMQAEEGAFPRGGGSVLSSIEIKQASNEATKDVLFGKPTEEQPKKKKQKRKNKNDSEPVKETKKGVKVEGLSFGRLTAGTVVLGQISEVNELDLALSLPNNLTGYVPITSISTELASIIENLGEDEDKDLVEMFKVGQWVRAVVTENTTGTANQKKRIELSIEPERVNSGVLEESDDLTLPGIAIQGSVRSVEDHGCVMNIGSDKVFGFISKKELGHANLNVSPGSVLLLTVMSKSSNGRTLTLTASPLAKKVPMVSKLAASASLTAGQLVECPITDVRASGLVTKVMEFANGVVDQTHSGKLEPLDKAFEVGKVVKARVVCLFTDSDPIKVALSLQPSVLGLKTTQAAQPLESHPRGEKVQVTVQHVGLMGLYVKFDGKIGFVHVSSISDKKIDDLSSETAYAKGTTHQAKITGHASVDDMYTLAMSKSVLDQKYLRAADVAVGEVVQAAVEKIIPGKGISIKITDTISGFADELHLSDIKLAHPEKKFKPGQKVKAKVLSNDKKRVRLTLKKSLVNTEDEIITAYTVPVGHKSPGVIVSLKPQGAIVEFANNIKAFLPLVEMSEAFIKDPSEHFSLGQCVAVRVVQTNEETQRMTVTCRSGPDSSESFKELAAGSVVSAEVVEKPRDSSAIVVRLDGSGLRGVIPAGHLSDEGSAKHKVGVKNIKVDEKLSSLVVLEKDVGKRFVTLSAKKSLVADATQHKLPCNWSDVSEGKQLHGYVRNITKAGLFVGFANRMTGLVPVAEAGEEFITDLGEKFTIDQSITCRVLTVDDANQRFLLTLKSAKSSAPPMAAAVNPIDAKISDVGEFAPGCVTKAKVVSVKDTQVNVVLADNKQGRIDASMAFDTIKDMKNVKSPLQSAFKKGDVIDVKIIGYHDARNHKFLPISHRNATHMVAECSCRAEDLKSSDSYTTIQLDKIKVGSKWTAIVNNVTSDFVWVHLSPTVRGRISVLDMCTSVDQVTDDLEEIYPIGSAVECAVQSINNDLLKLSVREAAGKPINTPADVKVGAKLPGVVVKMDEKSVTVRLGAKVFATTASMCDISDEFEEDVASTAAKFAPHQLVKCKVVAVSNNSVKISLRKSLFETCPVEDKLVTDVGDIGRGEVIRGFVKNIADSGVFVELGRGVTGRVEIRNLSDMFVKEWKDVYSKYQRVSARVLSTDNNKINLTLKQSAVTGERKVVGISDLQVGQFMDGSIKRVEDYGVFVRLQGGASGLCHKSEVADIAVSDLSKVFSVGDKVKVKVLKVDTEKNRLALGMKASYFGDDSDEEMDGEEESEQEDQEGDESDEEMLDMGGAESEQEEDSESKDEQETVARGTGLSAGIDWSGDILDKTKEQGSDNSDSEEEEEEDNRRKKKKRSKAVVSQDVTANLNTKRPQSVQDFERMLLGSPNSSQLWIEYMGFQVNLSEIDKARDIAERALKTIGYRAEQEKLNIWIAMLNMEHSFGTEETLDQVFKRACQYNDPKTIHLKLINTYLGSQETSKAEKLYTVACKKFGASDWTVYSQYIGFLLSRNKPEEAKRVLDRGLQALPRNEHRLVLTKYAQLQFENGFVEQGRTFFEQLVSAYPKRVDLWSVYIDYEVKYGGGNHEQVRQLFERLFKHVKLNIKKGRFFFKKWFAFEEANGDDKNKEYVTALARQFVESKQEKDDEEEDEE